MQFYEHHLDIAARHEAMVREVKALRLLDEYRRGNAPKTVRKWSWPLRVWELVRG